MFYLDFSYRFHHQMYLRLAFLLALTFVIGILSIMAQTSYYYPLNNSYSEATGSAPALVPLANDLGQMGGFTSVAIPSTTCSNGVFDGYEYPDNAGLRFDMPAGAISCEYSIQFTWKYDNPGSFQEWIRMLSFIYTDDSGLDIWTQPPNMNGGMYFWHLEPLITTPICFSVPTFGALSSDTYFNDIDYYQITLTRQCNDVMSLFVNGSYLGGFTDTGQRYMPQAPSNQIVFFRDTADTSCYPTAFPGEASSGFIKDLLITDYAFNLADIIMAHDTFCPIVLPMSYAYVEAEATAAGNQISWAMEEIAMVDQFEVARSHDGLDFEIIQSIVLSADMRNRQEDFSVIDQQVDADQLYYRIRARDLNGQILESRLEEVIAPIQFQVYPNPASKLVWIDVPEISLSKEVEIWSIQGQILRRQALSYGRNQLSLEGLPDGMLLLKIGTEEVIRLIKRH